jgi:hypothetical protein
MTLAVYSGGNAISSPLGQTEYRADARPDADRILEGSTRFGAVDAASVQRAVAALRAEDAVFGETVEQAVLARLTPVQQGDYARAAATPEPSATTVVSVPPASAPVGAPANENPPSGPDPVQLGLDIAQMTLDITGIIEPTPFSDGSNAVISAGRAIGSLFGGDLGEAGGHLLNGTLSAIGIIPYLGDAAKAGKIGKWAQTVADAVRAMADNPALRATLEPALREVRDLVNRIPQGAIDALPQSARESLERMKRQLDELFAGAAEIVTRRFDDAGAFNRAANNAAPNTRYEFGTYSYTTDARGRVATAEGRVTLTPANRPDPDLQRRIGDEGRPTDIGFHVIADRFGGQTNRLNVVPGNGVRIDDGLPNLNQGAYKRFENMVARLAEDPAKRVEVRIEMRYDPANASSRPDMFEASYRVNGGQWRTQSFDNK